ncbi:MAG: phosphopantothenoylcysteine decarboxylase, partial [Candidatus Zixiibacteriota bacterium]
RKIKKPKQKIIGFALETQNGIENAVAKLKAKGLDMIVLNSLEDARPFGGETSKVTLLFKDGRREPLPVMSKKELARLILEQAGKL